MTSHPVSKSSNTLVIGAWAGCVGGVVDLVPTLAMQAALGIGPVRVLQAIASGAMGASAFAGGIGSAAAGLLLHFALSIACGVTYAKAAASVPRVREGPWLAGPAFGVLFYAVMRYIVLPLSPVAFPLSSAPAVVATSLFFHAFLFGLPIAITVWSLTLRRDRQHAKIRQHRSVRSRLPSPQNLD